MLKRRAPAGEDHRLGAATGLARDAGDVRKVRAPLAAVQAVAPELADLDALQQAGGAFVSVSRGMPERSRTVFEASTYPGRLQRACLLHNKAEARWMVSVIMAAGCRASTSPDTHAVTHRITAAHQAPLGIMLGQDGAEVIARARDHDAPARSVGHPGPLRALRPESLLCAPHAT